MHRYTGLPTFSDNCYSDTLLIVTVSSPSHVSTLLLKWMDTPHFLWKFWPSPRVSMWAGSPFVQYNFIQHSQTVRHYNDILWSLFPEIWMNITFGLIFLKAISGESNFSLGSKTSHARQKDDSAKFPLENWIILECRFGTGSTGRSWPRRSSTRSAFARFRIVKQYLTQHPKRSSHSNTRG